MNLSSAPGNRPAAPMPPLSSVRIVDDLSAVPYPESVKTPNLDLNIAVVPGKFRYDREFLMQFMDACKGKPDSLAPLSILGLEPYEGANSSAGPQFRERRRVGTIHINGTPSLARQASMGLGLGPGLAKGGGFAMGQFQSPSRDMDSPSRFNASNNARGPMPFAGPAGSRLTPMTRSASQGGVGGGGPREAKRTRSQRGNNRGKSGASGGGSQTLLQDFADIDLDPFALLEVDEDRWFAETSQHTLQKGQGNQLVERKVTALLNKLTVDKFDSISDQIITYANRSEQEKDGSTLMQTIYLVFEYAKEDARFTETYARLCHKMMEYISPNVRDQTIRAPDVNQFQTEHCSAEAFERGWSAKGGAPAAAKSKAVLYSDEYYVYAATKSKRQGLNLVRFIGELFNLCMLTERVMHECIEKLLSNIFNPEGEEIESLCVLLTTAGRDLDNPKARNHMDIYFERMNEMARRNSVNSRMHFMLLDVIELRSRQWHSRSGTPPLQRHDKGNRNMQRGGSRRGERREMAEPAGWNVAGGASTRPPARAGDLSQFGKISKSSALQFGPTSVFSKKGPKREARMRCTGGANMFAALSGGGAAPMLTPMERTQSSRKTSVDLGPGGAPSGERRKLNLAPRTKPLENKEEEKEEDKEEDKEEAPAPAALSEAEAKKKVEEDIKEYLGVENVDEAILALEDLPAEHRHLFVDKLVSSALDGGNKVAVLAEKLFAEAHKRSVISPESFENGLLPTVEFADDISIDVPKTYE